MKTFECKDLGMDCDWKAQGETEDQILDQSAEHGRTAHGINEFTQELKEKIRSKIHDRSQAA